jgi:fermentation-respiration switch protein FrsA (DUF1100 family)
MKNRFKRLMTSLLFILCGVYFGMLILLFLMQSRLVYFPSKEIVCTPADIRLQYEDITMKTSDGLNLNAWFVPAKSPTGTVLFCHGNGGNISYALDVAETLNKFNLNVLLFDYRGYGKSEGSPTENGTYADADTAYRWLIKDKNIPEDSIIVIGRSLGAAIAANLAKNHNPRLLILESGFSSTADVAAKQYPIFPVRLLCRYKYKTADYVKDIKCPLLVVHSPDDEIVHYSNGIKIFNSAKEPKEFLEIRGSHNEGYSDSGDTYTNGLKDFIGEVRKF